MQLIPLKLCACDISSCFCCFSILVSTMGTSVPEPAAGPLEREGMEYLLELDADNYDSCHGFHPANSFLACDSVWCQSQLYPGSCLCAELPDRYGADNGKCHVCGRHWLLNWLSTGYRFSSESGWLNYEHPDGSYVLCTSEHCRSVTPAPFLWSWKLYWSRNCCFCETPFIQSWLQSGYSYWHLRLYSSLLTEELIVLPLQAVCMSAVLTCENCASL